MADFVINEWLWEDASGINGTQAQRDCLGLISMLAGSEHRIVVMENSPFEQKVWNLCKSTNIVVRSIVREFLGRLRYNLDRCVLLKAETAADLPAQLAAATKADDHYLVKAQLTIAGAILVTTDEPLREAVVEAGLSCLFRNDFLRRYL